MHTRLLAILRCPYCGSRLSVAGDAPQRRRGDELDDGILSCECYTFPVVAGIPVLHDDFYFYHMKDATHALTAQEGGKHDRALADMLRLDERRKAAFQGLVAAGPGATYRDLLDFLIPEAEGKYFAYRFSDPTYLVSRAVWRALGGGPRPFAGRVLDLCGGAGHLTRLLALVARGAEVILTDMDFRMLWLAKQFLCPGAQPVCCDANFPLPFDDGAFSGVACSDAFHYVRAQASLSRELIRLAGDDGVIALTHLHNRLCANIWDGWPLDPRWYRCLFAGYGARLFRESTLLDSFLSRRAIDLARDAPDDGLRDEPALCLIASRREEVFRLYEGLEAQPPSGPPRLNPLYHLEPAGEAAVLHRRFPSAAYEEEFQACKRYLPERVDLSADTLRALQAGRWDDALRELGERYVVLDLPPRY